MSATSHSESAVSRDDIMSALFANMILQQTNMALMLLGKVPHPETGETLRDLDGARMFIDQLEMIEFKTQGNLSPQEDKLLKQSLTGIRMAFVEAVEHEPATSKADPSAAEVKSDAAETSAANPDSATPSADPGPESRKKFSKSYE
jgi:hypothetical protein